MTVTSLFAAGRTRGTLLLWGTVFLSVLIGFFLVNRIPAIAQQSGRGNRGAAMAAVVLNPAGILGSVCLGRLIDRFGSFRIICFAYIGAALVIASLGIGSNLISTIVWFAGLVGFLCLGAQLRIVAGASDFYPLQSRATGLGWAMEMSGFGAIAGSLIGGVLMSGSPDHKMHRVPSELNND